MQPGAGRSQVVRVNATVTYDGATVPMGINLAEVSTTRELVTGADQRALTVVMRAGDKVLLIGDEAERFERAWRGEMTPGLDAEADLTPEQRRYVQAVFDYFHVEGQWPTYWGIGRKLVRELDVQSVVASLPPDFVNADSAWEAKYDRGEWASPAMLFLPALRCCHGAEGELAAFLAALHLCLERHADPDLNTPEIADADLRGPLQLDESMARKTALLLRQEPQILGSGGGAPGTPLWHHAISPDINRYRGVRRIDEYLERRSAPAAHLGGAVTNQGQLGVAPPHPPKVFLVHGHDRATRAEATLFLERLGLEVVILEERPNAGRTIIEKFEHHADVHYAVVLLTGDDRGGTRDQPYEAQRARARQNVILELGYFAARLGRQHVCALHEPGVEVPSDFQGVLYVPLEPHGAWHLPLARELRAAGLPIDLNKA